MRKQIINWGRFFVSVTVCHTPKKLLCSTKQRFALHDGSQCTDVLWCATNILANEHFIGLAIATLYTHVLNILGLPILWNTIVCCSVGFCFCSFVNKWRHSVVQVYEAKTVWCACQAADKPIQTYLYSEFHIHIHIRSIDVYIRILKQKRYVGSWNIYSHCWNVNKLWWACECWSSLSLSVCCSIVYWCLSTDTATTHISHYHITIQTSLYRNMLYFYCLCTMFWAVLWYAVSKISCA